jgi:hypothetical protein
MEDDDVASRSLGEGGGMRACHDPHRKAVLSNLQQMWMVLADERRFLTPQELAREVEAIGRLHAGLDGADEPVGRRSKFQLY